MEATMVYWGYIGITAKKMETTKASPKVLSYLQLLWHAAGVFFE